MTVVGQTTVKRLEDYWGHGPEYWGLPPDTDPESKVYVYRGPEMLGGLYALDVEDPGQEHLPVPDRHARYIPGPDGGIFEFRENDLPPEILEGE